VGKEGRGRNVLPHLTFRYLGEEKYKKKRGKKKEKKRGPRRNFFPHFSGSGGEKKGGKAESDQSSVEVKG